MGDEGGDQADDPESEETAFENELSGEEVGQSSSEKEECREA